MIILRLGESPLFVARHNGRANVRLRPLERARGQLQFHTPLVTPPYISGPIRSARAGRTDERSGGDNVTRGRRMANRDFVVSERPTEARRN